MIAEPEKRMPLQMIPLYLHFSSTSDNEWNDIYQDNTRHSQSIRNTSTVMLVTLEEMLNFAPAESELVVFCKKPKEFGATQSTAYLLAELHDQLAEEKEISVRKVQERICTKRCSPNHSCRVID